MKTSLQKGLLILMMLVLALAPMRAAWAMPASTTTDTEDHCAQMQHNAAATTPGTDQHAQDTGTHSDHPCNSCCGSDCNAANCHACAHGVTAASSIVSASADIPSSQLALNFVYSYPERSISPPLRPPASL